MKRRYLTLGGVLLLAAVWAVWQIGYHGLDPRLIFWPPPAEVPPPAALQEAAELDVADMTLTKVLDTLAERHDVTIELDSFALASTGLTGNETITLRLSGVSLQSLLAHVGREFDLVVRARGGGVFLTTENDWVSNLSHYVPRAYTLEKLLASPQPFDEEQLADLVTTLIAPTNWEDAGGVGVCTPLPGGLVISQTPELQDQVARLLDKLVEANSGPTTLEPIWLTPPSQRTETIVAALRQTASINCHETPLATVLAQLSQAHGVPIHMHRTAAEGVGVSGESPVNCQVKDISLASALGHLLRPQELTFAVRDEAILITTPEVADKDLEICLYPVVDLLDRHKHINADALLDTITTNVSPTTWENAGGAGSIKFFGGCLAVSQTQGVHEQLEELLSLVRHALSPDVPLKPKFQPTPAQSRLDAALAANVSLKFDKTPLEEVAARLSKEQGIQVRIDIKALDGIGISPLVPVTFGAHDVPLGWALRWMLKPLDLSPTVRGESLVITWPEVADSLLETRCYRFRRTSLLRAQSSHSYGIDFDSWIDVITSSIAPPNWEDAGGAGAIGWLGNVLIVSQTREVHETILDLLSKVPELQDSPLPAAPVWVGKHAAPWCTRLDAALAKTTSLEFEKVPLSQVLVRLSAEHHIPFQLDESQILALAEPDRSNDRSRPTEWLVSCALRNVSLRQGLDQLLDEHGLSYTLNGGGVVITAPVLADGDTRVRLYDARDLRDPSDVTDSFSKLIAPTTWEDAGGAGSIYELEGVLVVAQSADVHRRIEQFLELLRRLPANPTDLAPLKLDHLADIRAPENEANLSRQLHSHADEFIRLYPAADLLRRELPKAPPVTGHRLPYYLQRLRATTPPFRNQVLGTFERPTARSSGVSFSFEQALTDCLSNTDVQCEFFGNYVILAADHNGLLDELGALLARIRQVRSLPEEAASIQASPEKPDSPAGFAVFDLRPLFKRYPDLTEGLLEDWLLDQVVADPWANSPSFVRPRTMRPFGIWSGLLLVTADRDLQRKAYGALDILARLPEGLPRPGDLARDNARIAPQFAAVIENENDPLRLEYVLWLAGRVEKPDPGLVRSLVKRLERTDLERETHACARLYVALGSYGPLAADAVPLISAHAQTDDSSEFQWLRVEALAALGPRGVAELSRLSAQQPALAVHFSQAVYHSPWKKAAFEVLLPLLVDSTQKQKDPLILLQGIDPQAIAARELLDEWRDKDPDPERRRVAVEAEEVLKQTFGERGKR